LRAVPTESWAKAAFLVLCVLAVAGFVVYPTYPNYDSYYSLLWGRELWDGTPLSFEVYRAPTQHPLAIAFGALLVPLGEAADRVMVACCIASFLVLVWGLYRLGRVSFGALAGAVAALLLCTRFDFPFLAVRGYLDIPFLAMIVWAAILEIDRPRRGVPVFLLLVAAGLLRPEAWVLTGLYFLWCSWRAPWRRIALYAVLTAAAPVGWALVDWAVTGDPLFSLTYTSASAEDLGRAKGLNAVPSATKDFLIRLDKLPVVLGGVLGVALALWYAPRRAAMPFVLLLSGLATFGMVGVAGLSVIQRYLLVPALMLMVFAGVAVGGFTMLRPGTRTRRVWSVLAGAIVLFALVFTVLRVSVASLDDELAARGRDHASLEQVLRAPAVRAGLACGAVSVPTHKLVPDVRWMLDREAEGVVARSDGDPAARRAARRGVALVVLSRSTLSRRVFVDSTVNPTVNLPPAGFRRAATSADYAAYVRC